MSEMTLFEGGLPSHLKDVKLDDDTKALMGGSGIRTHRISMKGKTFRMMVNGEEISYSEEPKMNVTFVKFATKPSREFYVGQYKDGAKVAPLCWSPDGEKPSPEAEQPQSKTCESCPQNIKGSSENGESRACKFKWRTAVVLDNDVNGEIYQLILPATSVFGKGEKDKWPFKAYATYLGTHSIPLSAVVTEMKFDPKSPVPKVTFRPVRALSEDEYNTVRNRATDIESLRAINMGAVKSEKKVIEHSSVAEKVEEPDPIPVKKPNKKAEAEKEIEEKKDSADVLSRWADEDDD